MSKKDESEKLKIELMQDIETRVNCVINDNRAFLYSKIQQAKENRSYVYAIGGGNFLMTHGAFSVLNLLSKINSLLNGTKLWTKTEKKELTIALKKFKKENPKFIKLSLLLFVNNPKEPEKNCFIKFYTETKNIISWGIKNEEAASEFWNDYRNKLSHIALPRQPVASHSPDQLKNIDFDNFITYLRTYKKDIIGLNGMDDKESVCTALNIELLSEKLSDIFLFIKNKIENCSDEYILKNIKALIS